MRALVIAIGFGLCLNASAENQVEGCEWTGQILLENETIFVSDQGLVEEMTENLIADGYKPSEAQKIALKSDWSGYLLVCTKSIEPSEKDTAGIAGKQFVMVISDTYVEYFMNVQNSRNSVSKRE